jgi:hypothetical protein
MRPAAPRKKQALTGVRCPNMKDRKKIMPRPETTRAVLPNSRGAWTHHKHVETREIEVRSSVYDVPAWGHFFACEVTGEVRLWGYE